MELWNELFYQVVSILAIGLAGIAVRILATRLEKIGALQFLSEKRELTTKGVEFVEQLYFDLNGTEKYQFALNWIVQRLQEANIPYTEEELKGLIEAAVHEMKLEWRLAYGE